MAPLYVPATGAPASEFLEPNVGKFDVKSYIQKPPRLPGAPLNKMAGTPEATWLFEVREAKPLIPGRLAKDPE